MYLSISISENIAISKYLKKQNMYFFTVMETAQPSPILEYFCSICRKGYCDMASLREALGLRMCCSKSAFTCPERRHFEMRRHKEIKHNI